MASTKHNRRDPARDIVEAAALDLIKLTHESGSPQKSTIKISGHPVNSIAVSCTPTDKGSSRILQIDVTKVGTVKLPLRSFRRINNGRTEKVPGTAVFAVSEKTTVHAKSLDKDLKALAKAFTRSFLEKMHLVEGTATMQRQKKRERAEALDVSAYA